MSQNDATYHLQKLKRKYLAIRGGEVLLWSVTAGLLAYSIAYLVDVHAALVAGILIFAGAGMVLTLKLRLHRTNLSQILSFINARHPSIEESADLLITPDDRLTLLERLQKQKAIDAFTSVYPVVKFQNHLVHATISTAVCVLILLGASSFSEKNSATFSSNKKNIDKREDVKTPPLPAMVKTATVTIQPPVYTQLKISESKDLNLTVPENSSIRWTFEFTNEVTAAYLKFSKQDSLKLTRKQSSFYALRSFSTRGIYQLVWRDNKQITRSSDYYQIEIVPDTPPEISIKDLPQSTALTINDRLAIELQAAVSDDYRVSDAYVIATVAKGSGESVKFREEKMSFTSPAPAAGKSFIAHRNIDLKKLGLEPGDEIYFYVEGLDNKQPTPGKSRTETYFVTLMDTAEMNVGVDAGLGVDLMPEYFRSQRQIIIDTEKLIRNKKSLDDHTFKATSNELGYDQKVLRLKYGEFLGEEFESELAPSDNIEEQVSETAGNGKELSMTEKFGHAHDKDNEHNLVEDKKASKSTEHDHHDAPGNPEEKENPLKEFVHAHDDTEEATFFLQSVRAKLKAALTEMWDAELYLRLYQPEKSLPYQYKALKLLKEVSNDSRIYVHKTGFDPPPIKEEKRLTADLNEVKESRLRADAAEAALFPGIRKAANMLDKKIQIGTSLFTPSEKKILSDAGQEFAALAMEKPAAYLVALSAIKNLNEELSEQPEVRLSRMQLLLKKCLSALPSDEKIGQHAPVHHHALDQSFINNLQKTAQ